MPKALESKLFWVPFSVTVTTPGLPARMVMSRSRCSSAPRARNRTRLLACAVVGDLGHEVSPLATETVTTVSVEAEESEKIHRW